MSQADITRLVVGEPFTLGLGRAVGQGARTADTSKTLQWRDGKWQGTTSLLSKITPKKRTKFLVMPVGATKRVNLKMLSLTGGLLAIALAGVGLGLLLRSGPDAAPSAEVAQPALPVLPVSENVRSVDQPFPQMPDQPLQVIETADTPLGSGDTVSLPFGPPAGATTPAAAPSLPIVQAQPAPLPMPSPIGELPKESKQVAKVVPASTRSDTKEPTKSSKEEAKPAAVILDELVEKATKPAAQTRPEVAVKATVSPAPVAPASPVAATPKPATTAGKGLVAITPDGKSAVFTDPATRLPKQFKSGDKLPNGETIRSIDAKQGKVLAGSTEYSLD